MKEIVILETIYGYEFHLKNDSITYSHIDGPDPDVQEVMPLFQAIQENRAQAIDYLKNRSQLVDIASHLWTSAEKAQKSAIRAERFGNDEFAQKEWQRSVRLFAGAAKAFGITEPHIPWDDWVVTFAAKKGYSSGGKEKV